MSTVNTRLSEIEGLIRKTIENTNQGELTTPEEFKMPAKNDKLINQLNHSE